jgi:2'-hydroxyisoflavone reductase
MRILILGGTRFLGRGLVESALARGHQVTLFNRGQSNPDIFPQAEHLTGDRDGNLEALRGREWDNVIDTSGYVPRLVRDSAQLLAGEAGQYTFISTISVYPDMVTPGQNEDSPLGEIDDPTTEEITGETYGPLKVLCEQAVEAAFPGRALIVRPGYIVGPYDLTERWTYWPRRVSEGGTMLVPGAAQDVVQFIDVRDLSDWTIRAIEEGLTGRFNLTGLPMPMGDLLSGAREVTGSDTQIEWVPWSFLEDRVDEEGSELPIWAPPEYAGFHRHSIDRALATGLTFRPLAHTIRDTLAWDATLPGDRVRRAGMTRERECELLLAWESEKGSPSGAR